MEAEHGGLEHPGLMSIGLFSRAALLSVKSLRSYHETGLLVPVEIDPSTGYRRYHHSQLTDAGVIRRLRQLDVSLADIARVMNARDPEVTREVLARHEQLMLARLDETLRIVDELSAGIEAPALHSPIHRRLEPARHILAIEGECTEPEFPQFLGGAFGELASVIGGLGIESTGADGALYPPTIVDDGAGLVVAFVPIDEPVVLDASTRGRVGLRELPGQTCAVAAHYGGYDTLDITYRQLGAWVSQYAEPADQPVREHYLVSYTDDVAPDEFRTEILWPVRDINQQREPQP